MKLIKTTFFSLISTFIKISSGFVASKIVSIYTGPGGLALIGAFTNFITILLTFANGAINTGVVKYTAEYFDDDSKLKNLFSTSLKISIYCSLFISLILVIIPSYVTKLILGSEIYIGPTRALGFTIILYSLNSLLLSILNGTKEIRKFTVVNTIGSVVSLIFTLIFVYFYSLEGALYSLVLSQSLVFFVTLFLTTKSKWFKFSFFTQKFDNEIFKKLSKYSMMASLSALLLPLSQIILRNVVIENVDVSSAGYWQGMMKISDGYLLLINTALNTYYLPKLSSIKTEGELRKEILYGYKVIMPVVIIGCIIIYFLRFWIIETLYTPDFQQMEKLFLWQLIGDVFKIAAYILGYLMIAKAMIKTYILNEIIFTVFYIVLGYLLILKLGVLGITLAFSINYLLCLIGMVIIFRKILVKR